MDVYGQALYDFYFLGSEEKLMLHNSYGEPEEMPIEAFFSDIEERPELETFALELCKGHVLDIGAGAGSHSLVLQANGIDVTAIEISEHAVEVMRKRGIRNILHNNIFDFRGQRFDTLLMLMNGIGLTGTLQGLSLFLRHAKEIVKADGQLIFDSSDIAYLYEGLNFPKEKYYGEISYQYEYKGAKGEWFRWLYVDQETLKKIAVEEGWFCQIIYEDKSDHYLARLMLFEV